MKLKVDLVSAGARPPEGTPVVVQLRDTSLEDVAAEVLAEEQTVVQPGSMPVVASVVFDVGSVPPGTTVWARAASSGNMEHINKGDFITMSSYPVGQQGRPITVEIKKVV